MANQKAKPEYPALVDYNDTSSVRKTRGSQEENSTFDYREYWSEALRKLRTGTLPWTIKELKLWKRLVIQYGDDLYAMIDRWMVVSKAPAKFVHFYMSAASLHARSTPKDYSDFEDQP